jgi:phosphatidylglycerophosphate synthase
MSLFNWKTSIPWFMVFFRVFMAPIMVFLALKDPHPQAWMGSIIIAACLSDIFDGILARRWGTENTPLRVSDTIADTLFYLSVLATVLILHREVLLQSLLLLTVLLSLEALRIAIDWMKFRRMASYHTYSAKLWGLSLAAASVAVLTFDSSLWLLTLTLFLGILCDLEGLTISFILPVWTRDVKTIKHALEVRRELLRQS